MLKLKLFFCISFFYAIHTTAQTADGLPTEVLSEYDIRFALQNLTFLKTDSAFIHYDSLISFNIKLNSLKNTRQGKINIVHIGDSHIQAGYLTGVLRRGLQKRYGNAGRGIVFPYRLAKTNGPADYVSSSATTWKAVRNVFTGDSLATGITGFAIESNHPRNSFCIHLKSNEGIDYSFNHLQLFTNSLTTNVISVFDSTHLTTATLQAAFANNYLHNYTFIQNTNYFCVSSVQTDSNASSIYYGVNLLNDSAGIVCHTIGVNGAEYRHYLQQPLFFEHLKELNADLIILSLGTNEAFNKNFDRYTFIQYVDSSLKAIRVTSPNAEILITSPAESCIRVKRKRYATNPNVVVIRNALNDYCEKNKIAFFDLYTSAGGKGSMLKYANLKMSDARRIHFNKTVYEIHGMMLLDALLKNTK